MKLPIAAFLCLGTAVAFPSQRQESVRDGRPRYMQLGRADDVVASMSLEMDRLQPKRGFPVPDFPRKVQEQESPPPVLWSFYGGFPAAKETNEASLGGRVSPESPTEYLSKPDMVRPLLYDDTDDWMKPLRRDRDPLSPHKRWKAFLEGKPNPQHVAAQPHELSPFGRQWTVME